jgi:hypothetical protein
MRWKVELRRIQYLCCSSSNSSHKAHQRQQEELHSTLTFKYFFTAILQFAKQLLAI